MFADELAKMEVKFKEQVKINENMKLQLAAEEDRYKVNISDFQMPTKLFCGCKAEQAFRLSTSEILLFDAISSPEHSPSVVYRQDFLGMTFYCCLCQAPDISMA